METRVASCECGQLRASCAGPPLRVAICHCSACKRRTGSAFSWNARFAAEAVTITGTSRRFVRIGDDGGEVAYHFCPECGVTVHYQVDPAFRAIPVGAFADADFPAPEVSVYHAPDRLVPWLHVDVAETD